LLCGVILDFQMVVNLNFRSFILIFNERDSVNDAQKSYLRISSYFHSSCCEVIRVFTMYIIAGINNQYK
jgi:hypothetical protein